jgi:NAD(P)H dehydrogenase (quinone)
VVRATLTTLAERLARVGTQEAARGLIGNSDASGHLGRRVAERLARQGIRQRLLVQDRSPAPELPDSEVATISGYGDDESMPKALAGVETLLVIPVKEQPDRVRLHQAAVDAAVAAGVRRVVYSSFLGAAADVTFTFARDHFATEEHIRSTGVAFTFLRGSAFLEVIHWLIGATGRSGAPPGSQARLHARARSRYGTCQSAAGRWCWPGASESGAVSSQRVRSGPGPSRRSPCGLGRC